MILSSLAFRSLKKRTHMKLFISANIIVIGRGFSHIADDAILQASSCKNSHNYSCAIESSSGMKRELREENSVA